MLTRCPACEAAFKVTPEQLKLRAGKVRCGKCQTIFNALDSLDEAPAPPVAPAAARMPAGTPAEAPPTVTTHVDIELEPASEAAGASEPPADGSTAEDDEPPPCAEAVRDAAITHGLVAARETTEIPGYNKWAEGAFTAPIPVSPPTSRPLWPFVLAALALLLTLAGQGVHHFRAELAVSTPSLRPLLEAACVALECDIPLPRHVELVSIEASDLQADPARGGALMLVATLKNRAAYAQAWPLLEITLTDVQDNALLRRVLQPADYLPGKVDPTLFPPNGEIGIKLWLEAQDIAAAGYRLYVFYP